MDNLNTRGPGSLYRAFAPEQAKALWDRFEFIFTPKHGRFLNVAEIEINVMVSQCLNRRIGAMEEMEERILAWQAERNQLEARVNWHFNLDQARVKLKRLYPTLDV